MLSARIAKEIAVPCQCGGDRRRGVLPMCGHRGQLSNRSEANHCYHDRCCVGCFKDCQVRCVVAMVAEGEKNEGN